jgi:peptide/nickel transport system permease protein
MAERPVGGGTRLQYRIARWLALDNDRKMMGIHRARFLVTGAAPISPDLVKWYLALGVPMLEVWGMTETCGASTGMPPERIRPGSIEAVLGITRGSWGDVMTHMFLPVLSLSLRSMAGWARFVRSSMLEVLRQDYVRTARAKGLTERVIIAKHALRNALIPLVTIITFEIPALFGGAILTESVFGYPGMGRLYLDALGAKDFPVVQGFLMISAVLVIIATLLSDILYTVVDPRIRFS